MRGFKLYNKPDGKAVAEGIEFHNGKCALCWFIGDNTDSISIYDDIETVKNMKGCS